MALVTAGTVVLDCAEPERLAVIYAELLGARQTEASANRIEIRAADGVRMAFRRDASATPPSRPRTENLLQAHLDFVAADLDAAERRVVALGGRPVEAGNTPGPYEERGFCDPAGHSFTLRRGTPPTAPEQG
ncbi:VOC family protein [Streptomyces sp. AD55]|uniref:VOC family protein n=1 Tax=Streptomyces sp. AD55 TaxID=3242895 RepID=UPI0035291BC0